MIKIFPVIKSLFTLTPVEVPIPTERFGSILKLITSPLESSWEVDTETIDLTLSTFPIICGYTLSNEYLSLSLPLPRKYSSKLVVELMPVFIPIVLIFLLITYTIWFRIKSNWVPVGEVETAIFEPLFVSITGWLFVNGWFSI